MVLWGAVRNLILPVSARHLLPFSNSLHHEASSLRGMLFLNGSTSRVQPTYLFSAIQSFSLGVRFSTSTAGASFSSLTDTRFPKRRPGTKLRKKRASLKPPGPFAWVQYVPGEPIPRSQPNEGTVQGSKEKKRIKQWKAFILFEKKQRKAQFAEARKQRDVERIKRKMAAVAREKEWAQRLIELQQVEEAGNAVMC